MLTLLLGRFFCGWACPLGALLDLLHPLVYARRGQLDTRFPNLPYLILCFVLAGALFGLPVAGYLDPFSLLVRGLAVAVYPAFNHGTTALFTWTYSEAPGFIKSIEVKQPYVVDNLCIGCGICENKCPLPDQAAVYVTAAGEIRNPKNILPAVVEGYY